MMAVLNFLGIWASGMAICLFTGFLITCLVERSSPAWVWKYYVVPTVLLPLRRWVKGYFTRPWRTTKNPGELPFMYKYELERPERERQEREREERAVRERQALQEPLRLLDEERQLHSGANRLELEATLKLNRVRLEMLRAALAEAEAEARATVGSGERPGQ